MNDYDFKFKGALDEQRTFIDEIASMFDINKVRVEVERGLDSKMANMK
jgi:hypothetical protein